MRYFNPGRGSLTLSLPSGPTSVPGRAFTADLSDTDSASAAVQEAVAKGSLRGASPSRAPVPVRAEVEGPLRLADHVVPEPPVVLRPPLPPAPPAPRPEARVEPPASSPPDADPPSDFPFDTEA